MRRIRIPWRGSTSAASLNTIGRIFERSAISSSYMNRSTAFSSPASSQRTR